MTEFDKQVNADLDGIFLKEFSQVAIYASGSVLKTITVQFFDEALDKMGTQYQHAWCKSSDMPNISNNDKLTINNVVYGVIDFTVDEFAQGVDLFLQKV